MKKPLPKTPTLDAMLKVKPQSQAIGQFLDWLSSQKELTVCQYDDATERYWPARFSIEEIIAEHLGINLKKAEKEKLALLESIR